MQALLGGSVEMAAGGFMSVFLMHAEHRPVQAFFLLVRDPGYVALVSPLQAGVSGRLKTCVGP
jgi:hypothetical protein